MSYCLPCQTEYLLCYEKANCLHFCKEKNCASYSCKFPSFCKKELHGFLPFLKLIQLRGDDWQVTKQETVKTHASTSGAAELTGMTSLACCSCSDFATGYFIMEKLNVNQTIKKLRSNTSPKTCPQRKQPQKHPAL